MGALMPLFLWLDEACTVRGAGPTLHKIVGKPIVGASLTEVFHLRRPARISDAGDLINAHSLRLVMADRPGTGFKGVAVPLRGGDGVLINLSFGYNVHDAVREHALSATDFAPTDLAIELLYLAEAKDAVMAELEKINQRLRGARQQAEAQALTDALTGLGNRRALERALCDSIAAGRPFGLVQIDLDYFKSVNDTLGHAAGDHVLTEVAQALRDAVRGRDLVARVGGDEFVILMDGLTDFQAIRRIATGLLSRLAGPPILFEGQPCRISASMGAILRPGGKEGQSAEALLAAADQALYHSKRAGRSRLGMIDAAGRIEIMSPAQPVQSAACNAARGQSVHVKGDEA